MKGNRYIKPENKDKVKKHKASKGRSDLQEANYTAQWCINFTLQHFHTYHLYKHLIVSKKTIALIRDHNIIVDSLKKSIANDLANTKQQILAKRKKLIDDFNQSDIMDPVDEENQSSPANK